MKNNVLDNYWDEVLNTLISLNEIIETDARKCCSFRRKEIESYGTTKVTDYILANSAKDEAAFIAARYFSAMNGPVFPTEVDEPSEEIQEFIDYLKAEDKPAPKEPTKEEEMRRVKKLRKTFTTVKLNEEEIQYILHAMGWLSSESLSEECSVKLAKKLKAKKRGYDYLEKSED